MWTENALIFVTFVKLLVKVELANALITLPYYYYYFIFLVALGNFVPKGLNINAMKVLISN